MTHLIASVPAVVDIGRGLREALYMFWESLWALVLGFTLSGLVQSLVSRDKMRARLGDHHGAAVARASVYGMVSSSCSYAASAMAKSLFAKGADFTSAMIFMVASTNLVVELGVVLVVLLGWQFALGEFVGGPIMILLLALLGGYVFSPSLLAGARARLNRREGEGVVDVADPACLVPPVVAGNHEEHALDADAIEVPWQAKLRSPAALSDAAQYAVADVTMLRKELAIGYLVAGFLAALVPVSFWNSLFLHGHGNWTSIENAFVGPIVALISWVCSIGNVPLAAALWHGGISFGGVIAFVFADLISMPLILVYRKLYGWPLTLRIVALFYPAMVVAGMLTEVIFAAFHAVPARSGVSMEVAHFSWNYTTFLNMAFIVIAGGVWWFARNRARFGGGITYAIDPVCGMQVEIAHAPAKVAFNDSMVYFCSDRCRDRFVASPTRYLTLEHTAHDHAHEEDAMDSSIHDDTSAVSETAIDPVCHMTVDPKTAAAHRHYEDHDYWFCNPGCATAFDANPGQYLKDVS